MRESTWFLIDFKWAAADEAAMIQQILQQSLAGTSGAPKLKILLISGSLRRDSCNTRLVKACEAKGHPALEFEWAQIRDLPFFDEDVEKQGDPPQVERLKSQVRACDGLLLGLPEYNGAPSGVLKNAIDWMSRGMDKSVLWALPVGVVSAAGRSKGANSRKVLQGMNKVCNMALLEDDSVSVNAFEPGNFDEQGSPCPELDARIAAFLGLFAAHVDRHRTRQPKPTA